ncbi:MAG: hypothetical protein LBB11_00905 [Puniceicoccales bacterium]|jgi:hypothetical protein|nr:hypothetical protein [Puniceicoccales bacterium]
MSKHWNSIWRFLKLYLPTIFVIGFGVKIEFVTKMDEKDKKTSIDTTFMRWVGPQNAFLDTLNFLNNPIASAYVEILCEKLRQNFGFTGNVDTQKTENGVNDSIPNDHPKFRPLRIALQKALCDREATSHHFDVSNVYKDLMDQAHKLIENEDMPVPSVSVRDLEEASETISKDLDQSPAVYVILNMPSAPLQFPNPDSENKQDAISPIVQVATQFNGLESVNSEILPLGQRIDRKTQDKDTETYIQAIAASALRYAAHEQGKLPDALEPLLSNCKLLVQGEERSMNEVYPHLYENGCLQLEGITDLECLKIFAEYVQDNIHELRIQSQWVGRQESGTQQLQVFCSAPLWAGPKSKESNEDPLENENGETIVTTVVQENPPVSENEAKERLKAYEDICSALVVAEYQSLARMAQLSGRPLHLTAAVIKTFNNPPEILHEALKAVLVELEGSAVQVFLHGDDADDVDQWNRALELNGYSAIQCPQVVIVTQGQKN